MHCTAYRTMVIGVILTTAFGAVAQPAAAFTVTQNDDFTRLLEVLLGDTEGLSEFDGFIEGNPQAFGIFEDAPFEIENGVVLSTGRVEEIPGENTFDTLTTEFEPFNSSQTVYDTAALELSFVADETVESLFFQYVFGSEEFLEYSGTEFNDFFTLELNGSNLALLDDSVGEDNFVRVNNLTASPSGPFSSSYINNPQGPDTLTRLDGFTRPLTFEGDVVEGSNTLRIEISDIADSRLDSAVFIAGETLSTIPPDPTGVPEPSTFLGIAALGLLGAAKELRRKCLG